MCRMQCGWKGYCVLAQAATLLIRTDGGGQFAAGVQATGCSVEACQVSRILIPGCVKSTTLPRRISIHNVPYHPVYPAGSAVHITLDITMQPRSLLRSQLLRAWHSCIEGEYSDQLINSERGLQIYFCRHLLDEFENSGVERRLFIEPRVSLADQPDARYPDIVVCHTRRIIGVVEIKYLPRTRPQYEKDLNTLSWMSKHGAEVKLSNDRYRGEREAAREYHLAEDAVLCWAGVYTAPEVQITHPSDTQLQKRLSVMHAITESGKPAEVLPPLPPKGDA